MGHAAKQSVWRRGRTEERDEVPPAPEEVTVSYTFYRAMTQLIWPVAGLAAGLRSAAGHSEWRQRVGFLPPVNEGAVWLHAASVGEVAAVVPLARELAVRASGAFLTVVTPTGLEVASDTIEELSSAIAPLDFVIAVRRVLRLARPRVLLLTETELWPNTIYETAEHGVPIGMVNGRLSERSLRRYLMVGSPLRKVAPLISFAACRTEDDASRFRELGLPPSNVAAVGDMKFDKLAAPLDDAERAELRRSLGFPPEAAVVVFGSVRPKEEDAVASAAASVTAALPGSRIVVAPRHLERVPGVVSALESRGLSAVLRSDGVTEDAPAVVIDTTGELARIYAAGAVSFVGGTLAPYGGHDPLEPAAQGVPVVVGPHTETCRDAARRLIAAGAAFEVKDGPALGQELVRLLSDDAARAKARTSALNTIAGGRGATARTLEFLESNGVIDATA